MPQQLITDFYTAFSKGDAAGMTACYHRDIVFEDPAFGHLEGERAKAMWHMLLSSAGADGPDVSYSDVQAEANTGSARWRAAYAYGPKRRPVVNHVEAAFTFADGLILRHVDDFDLWAWSKQALGLPGYLLGWSPLLRRKIQAETGRRLDAFVADRSGK